MREQVEGRGKMEVPKYSRKGRRVGKTGGSKVGRSCRPDQDRAELCGTFILHKGPDRKLWPSVLAISMLLTLAVTPIADLGHGSISFSCN